MRAPVSHGLGAFGGTLSRADRRRMAIHVALSLATALAGSLAAVCLVPLLQSGRVLRFGGRVFEIPGGTGTQAAAFAAASVAFALLRWLTSRLAASMASRYAVHLRGRVHASLVGAPLAALADATSAEIANALTYNTEIVTQGFNALLQLLVAGVTTAVSLVLAFLVSPALLLAAPALLAVGLLTSRAHGREQSRVSRRYVADMTTLFWHSEDFPRRLRHVRSFGQEEAEQVGYGDISASLGRGYRRQLDLLASGRLALELAAATGITGVLVLAHLWRDVDRASLVAVSLLLGRLLPYLVSTRQSFQQLRSAVPALELWRRYTGLDRDRKAPAPVAAPAGTLRIERLLLASPMPALEVRDLALVPGELTLIHGDSGVGKSSLLDVLAGMLQPKTFAATLDGRPLDFEAYRGFVRRGAYVSQGVRPWQRTVRECLQWADAGASEEAMWQALADVGLDRRLADGRQGLDTALDHSSSRLSGGELQRLLLAQVILRKPFLALLDEATGALDVLSEMEVLSAVRRRLPEAVLVAVSHRPGLSALADRCLAIGSGDGCAALLAGDCRDLPAFQAAKAPECPAT